MKEQELEGAEANTVIPRTRAVCLLESSRVSGEMVNEYAQLYYLQVASYLRASASSIRLAQCNAPAVVVASICNGHATQMRANTKYDQPG